MKLLDIIIDEQLLRDNKQRLADLNKSSLYDRDAHIFDKIDFDNDEFFFDPSLFFCLLDTSGGKKLSVDQVCLGCRLAADKPVDLPVFFDGSGIAHLPGLGEFFDEELCGQVVWASIVPKERLLSVNGRTLAPLPGNVHAATKILFPVYLPEILSLGNKTLREPPRETQAGACDELAEAVGFLSRHCPEFFSLIELVTKEVIVFNSPDQNSFAAITCHGAAFLNTENKKQDILFFIDDLAHQCGHIIFNTLTLQTEEYLTLPKNIRLADVIPTPGHRTLYGALHGLFTYSCILHSLSAYFNRIGSASSKVRLSVLGRIGFYLIKFMVDLDCFYKIQHVFTEKGQELFQQFLKSYYSVHAQFSQYTDRFSYANQPYTFDESLFLELNDPVNVPL